MKPFPNLLTFFFCTISIGALSQVWSGSTDINNLIERNGMIAINGTGGAQLRLNSAGTYYGKIGNPSAQYWSLGWGGAATDLNPVLTWSAVGNVGIGTSTPGYRLELIKGSSPYLSVFRNAPAGSDAYFYNAITPGFFLLGSNANTGETLRKIGFTVGGGDTESDVKMTIGTTGNIGIGTLAPQFKLQVDGTIASGLSYFSIPLEVSTGYTRSSLGSNVYWHSATQRWEVNAIGNNDFSSIIHPNADGLAFITAPTVANAPRSLTNGEFMAFERMRITAGGFVGIGTRYPDEALTVKGKIHTQEVRVDLAGAVTPDYVFEKEYNLLPLSELELYIKANKHLPEVPSAKEMEADGMNLKEMNLILLKKVEELTLHLIAEHAEKDAMRKEMEVQKRVTEVLQKQVQELVKNNIPSSTKISH